MKMKIMLGEHQSLNHLILNSGDFSFFFLTVLSAVIQKEYVTVHTVHSNIVVKSHIYHFTLIFCAYEIKFLSLLMDYLYFTIC